jgi:DNA-binding response OmpR family regulator
VPQTTILVAEDFDAFRDFVCRELQQRPDFQVVEVSDGLDAVERAGALRPELILLDIGLPRLNGFEAARRIRACSPESKIIFLTQESSPDVVDEAFSLGSQGYVHKLRAHGFLRAAVEGILDGQPAPLRWPQSDRTSGDHQVQFYSGESILLDSLERFVTIALAAEDAAIVVATRTHLDALVQRLKGGEVNVERALKQGTFLTLDAADIVSRVVVNGVADREGFKAGLIQAVDSAARATMKPAPRIAVFGECVALLCAAGEFDAAFELESTGNEMVSASCLPVVDIVCAYPLHTLKTGPAFRKLCAAHTTVAVR